MTTGLSRGPRRWTVSNDSVGFVDTRRGCRRNECEAGYDHSDHGGSMYTPPMYFVLLGGMVMSMTVQIDAFVVSSVARSC